MATRILPRTNSGELILPGKVKKVFTWPFMVDTTLPSTLAATGTGANGTVAVTNQSAGTGEMVITSLNNNKVTVSTATTINLGSFEAVWFEVEGTWNADTNVADQGISLNSGTNGLYMSMVNGTVKIRGGGDIANVQIDTTLTVLQSRRNIGLIITPRSNHAYVMMGDQVIADLDLTGGTGSQGTLVIGPVNATVWHQSTGTTTSVMHIQQMRLITSSF